DALAQIGRNRGDDGRARIARSVARRLQAALDVLGDGRAVQSGAPGDGGEGQALPVEIQDHHKFPEIDHRRLPSRLTERMAHDGSGAGSPYSGSRIVGSPAGNSGARSVEDS